VSSLPCITPAPVGQQRPPTRVTAFDSWRSLRDARGPLLLATGTGPCLGMVAATTMHADPPKMGVKRCKVDTRTIK
jgi:hypothetical protein